MALLEALRKCERELSFIHQERCLTARNLDMLVREARAALAKADEEGDMLTVTIETTNDTFAGPQRIPELVACLERAAASLRIGSGKIYDTNGNTVGRWTLTPVRP